MDRAFVEGLGFIAQGISQARGFCFNKSRRARWRGRPFGILSQMIAELEKNGRPENWTGVIEMSEK